MSTELIINASLPETRIALMEDGEIQDLLIERAQGKGIVGNIYKGRVTRVLPGMQAAFVDIGLEKAAFLYVDDVFVHSEIWEREEGSPSENESEGENEFQENGQSAHSGEGATGASPQGGSQSSEGSAQLSGEASGANAAASSEAPHEDAAAWAEEVEQGIGEESEEPDEEDEEEDDEDSEFSDAEDDEDDEESEDPVRMGPGGDGSDDDNAGNRIPGTVSQDSPASHDQGSPAGESASSGGDAPAESGAAGEGGATGEGEGDRPGRRRHRRGRRGGRSRNRRDREPGIAGQAGAVPGQAAAGASGSDGEEYPENYQDQLEDQGKPESDRSSMSNEADGVTAGAELGRPDILPAADGTPAADRGRIQVNARAEFKAQRGRDRRIKSRSSARPRGQGKIEELLKEGQEVLVQVAKDPISTKGARLTCHISLPGRHLVCMPTIDHVGVSRRIERDDERRRLREYVERARPKNLGFIVRTASGKQAAQSEKRIKQDVEYLARLWDEIRDKAATVSAPALVYEDLNSVLRAIRDWVTEDIDKIVVDSRYHFNEIQRFVSHFMPSLKQKIDLYHGDIPIFDAYGISTELARALERKVWLKSGGYIVVDQAEALVAIDVNTGRYVGKKSLEDTILKTNLEAVQEIAYQLRLRNCGGIIILDLIDMEKEENKKRVYHALEEALKRDRARPSILKISELGLVEMTRKRTRDTMVRALCESCTHCEGKGFIKSKLTVAYEVLREIEREGIERDIGKILVQAHADVIDILAIDERETLDQIERRYRKQIYLQAVTDYHQEQFEVIGDKKGRKEVGESVGRTNWADRHERGGSGDRERGERDRGRRGGRGRDRDRDRERGGRDRDNRDSREGSSERSGGGGAEQPARKPFQIVRPSSLNRAPEGSRTPEGDVGASENMGNEMPGNVISGGRQDSSGAGDFNSAAQPPAPQGPAGQTSGDDFFENEEDRLAFLRAQAAQDAALARLRNAGDPSIGNRAPSARGPGGGAGQGKGGDRDRNGGRRGRRGRRGGKQQFRRDEAPAPAAGSRGPRVVVTRPEGQAPASGGGSGAGMSSGSGDSDRGEGGGSDSSNPPTNPT